MTPANMPGPTIATNINAQINELIDREETMINRAMGLTKRALGVVLRAAQKAVGTASIIAMIVPNVAMFMVSQTVPQITSAYSHLGGTMRDRISTPCRGASKTNIQIVLSDMYFQHTIKIVTAIK